MALVCSVVVLTANPAIAGTLTAISFTASGANNVTNTTNATYNWGFKTATTNGLSRVVMGVPAGTTVPTTSFVDLWASDGGYLSTPDSVATSITGNIDIRAKVDPLQWTGWGDQGIANKWISSTVQSYYFGIDNNGELVFGRSTTGAASSGTYAYSGVVGGSPGTPLWVRATLDTATGTVTFYKSSNGTGWTSLGLNSSGLSAGATYDGTGPLTVGSDNMGDDLSGKLYAFELRNGINGSVVSAVDPSIDRTGATSWTAATGEVWSMNRIGEYPIDIAGPLTVSSASGVPSGGTAYLRTVDHEAVYSFTGASVNASVACAITLAGFTNTPTAGSYTSTITTISNDPVPVDVDTATTAAQAFVDPSVSVTLTASVPPNLTFTVSGRSTACNSQAPTSFSTSSTATVVNMGSATSVKSVGGAQDLTVATNSPTGATVYLRTASAPNSLSDGHGHSIVDVGGSRGAPGAAPVAGTPGFGYTTSDATAAFGANKFAKVTSTNDSVLLASSAGSSSACVGYQAAVSAATPSAIYKANIIYTAVASF